MTIYLLGMAAAFIVTLVLIILHGIKEYKATDRYVFHILDLLGLLVVAACSWTGVILAFYAFYDDRMDTKKWLYKTIFNFRRKKT